jgi:TM2 domain-containing membrane protein YozV
MYYLAIHGQRSGPYEAAEVQRMLKQGAIGDDTLFWRDGMMDWQAIGAQKHLFETSYQAPQAYAQPQNFQQPGFGQQPHHQPMQVYQPQQMMMQPGMMQPPKTRVAYVLLGLFLGGLGVHNFYAGYTGKGVAQLLLTLFLWWTIIVPVGVTVWIIVEVCTVDRDAYGNPLT